MPSRLRHLRISRRQMLGPQPPVRTHAQAALLLALLGCLAWAPVGAAPLVPALTIPASAEHHVGKVVFVELITPDLARAKRFYGDLFGWSFTDIGSGNTLYSEASLDGRPVAGLFQRKLPSSEHKQPAWLGFLSVRDVDATKKVALAHGAKVLRDTHTVPARGNEAVLADPQGAVFALLASSSGDPPDLLAAPGEWIWSSLIARDAAADAAFYQTLFDYEVFDLSDSGSSEHLVLATDNYARASANTLPGDDAAKRHPHWLNFVRVIDAGKTAAQAVALGGSILIEPHPDRHGGNIAVIADPQGAPFGLLEWTENDSKEVTSQ